MDIATVICQVFSAHRQWRNYSYALSFTQADGLKTIAVIIRPFSTLFCSCGIIEQQMLSYKGPVRAGYNRIGLQPDGLKRIISIQDNYLFST